MSMSVCNSCWTNVQKQRSVCARKVSYPPKRVKTTARNLKTRSIKRINRICCAIKTANERKHIAQCPMGCLPEITARRHSIPSNARCKHATTLAHTRNDTYVHDDCWRTPHANIIFVVEVEDGKTTCVTRMQLKREAALHVKSLFVHLDPPHPSELCMMIAGGLLTLTSCSLKSRTTRCGCQHHENSEDRCFPCEVVFCGLCS